MHIGLLEHNCATITNRIFNMIFRIINQQLNTSNKQYATNGNLVSNPVFYQGRNFMLSKLLSLAALWNWALVFDRSKTGPLPLIGPQNLPTHGSKFGKPNLCINRQISAIKCWLLSLWFKYPLWDKYNPKQWLFRCQTDWVPSTKSGRLAELFNWIKVAHGYNFKSVDVSVELENGGVGDYGQTGENATMWRE